MPVYALGDVQGCASALARLLDRLRFDPGRDRLWLTGDLVNRGPDSLAVLRQIMALGDAATVVLGNHDLHLLAVASGGAPGRRDTFTDVLAAPDREQLLDWLRRRPLLHHDAGLGWTLVHAGLPPNWDLNTARDCAAAAEAVLGGAGFTRLLGSMYGDQPDRWQPTLRGPDRVRYTLNALTRMRWCDSSGRLLLRLKGAPEESPPPGAWPWFRHPARASRGHRIVFGHWSSLAQKAWPEELVWCLDTGCVWGQRLTALDLETLEITACDCG
ncbi:MAG: symmetrical bis(5'-nucleosyl)-tetraphosphatase [Gammaproteobacteria bacterium]|nr:symmetrical bis(5'-nucleosyl)-tetraphosphatase [Gammaproteobacteria bacterium]